MYVFNDHFHLVFGDFNGRNPHQGFQHFNINDPDVKQQFVQPYDENCELIGVKNDTLIFFSNTSKLVWSNAVDKISYDLIVLDYGNGTNIFLLHHHGNI